MLGLGPVAAAAAAGAGRAAALADVIWVSGTMIRAQAAARSAAVSTRGLPRVTRTMFMMGSLSEAELFLGPTAL
jgi:hypothetical protein